MPPVEFDLPLKLKGSRKWQIKIYDDEPTYEEAHVSVLFKEFPPKTWRVSLVDQHVFDLNPPVEDLPVSILNKIRGNLRKYREGWNQCHPGHKIDLETGKRIVGKKAAEKKIRKAK